LFVQDPELLPIILGKRIGVPRLENRIDRAAKRYLRKAWNARGRLTQAINDRLGTSYDVFTAVAR
jgi:hypothetical protein